MDFVHEEVALTALEPWEATAQWRDWLIVESVDGTLTDLGYVDFKWFQRQLDLTGEFGRAVRAGDEEDDVNPPIPSWVLDTPWQAKFCWTAGDRTGEVFLRGEALNEFCEPVMPVLVDIGCGVQKWWIGAAAHSRARGAGFLLTPDQAMLPFGR